MSSQYPHQQQHQVHYDTQSQSQASTQQPVWQQSPAIYVQQAPASSLAPYQTNSTGSQPLGIQSDASLISAHSPNVHLYHSLYQAPVPGPPAPASAIVHYGASAQPGGALSFTQPPTASSSTSSPATSRQAEPGVSSRIISSLQSLVTLLEKQNAKLEKHDERFKTLDEGFTQLKAETTKCHAGIESLSKAMTKKLKTFGDTTSKTLQEDIARALEKDLTKLREETAALGKISKKILGSDTTTKLTEIASLQGQLLQALSSNSDAAIEQADSIVERISDHQLDVLHRLSEQFRLVTASINTSSSAVRQAMEETTTRQDQASQLQFQQLLARLQCFSAAAIARPQVASAQIQEEGEDRFVMPTPPASQLPKALRKPSMPIIVEQPTASSSSHRCLAVECTSCLIQETPSSTQERSAMMVVITREGNGQNGVSPSDGRIPQHLNQASQGSETQLSTMPPPPVAQVELNGISRTMPLLPSSPNRQSNSPTRSNISKTRRSVKPMQPFVLKKRTIPQPEDEEEERVPEANEEEQVQDVEKIVEETQERQREVMPRSTIADRFALAYEKVEAWRYGTAAGQSTAISSNSALVTNQTCSFQADQNNDSPLASSSLAVLPETPAADVPSITRRSARANSKSKTAGTSLAPASKRAKRS